MFLNYVSSVYWAVLIHISIWFQNEDCIASGPGKDMFDSTRIIAEKQYNKGKVHFTHVITVIVHFTYSIHLHCVHYIVLYTCTQCTYYYIHVCKYIASIKELYESAKTELAGNDVRYKHVFEDFSNIEVMVNGEKVRLHMAWALGHSFT